MKIISFLSGSAVEYWHWMEVNGALASEDSKIRCINGALHFENSKIRCRA